MKFAIIAACDDKRGIGIQNRLPWRLKLDLAYFSEVTTMASEGKRNAVIMGRNTWLSLPEKHRPLADRLNVVLSKEEMDLPEGVLRAVSFEDAFAQIAKDAGVDQTFVIGGANVYAQAMNLEECDEIYLTRVLGEFQCDTFFPEIPINFKIVKESKVSEENGVKFKFVIYGKETTVKNSTAKKIMKFVNPLLKELFIDFIAGLLT